MLSKRQLGLTGEARARRHLQRLGYRFVEANHYTRYGEIDLVMRSGRELVFVEVKTRRHREQGVAEAAVTSRKLGHIARAAESYCQSRRYTGPWRIDVVAIDQGGIRHLPNVTAV